MSDNKSARDLAGVPDDVEFSPASARTPRHTSPSPIRSGAGGSPSIHAANNSATAGGQPSQFQPDATHGMPTARPQDEVEMPIWKQPFHMTAMAPPSVGPAAPEHHHTTAHAAAARNARQQTPNDIDLPHSQSTAGHHRDVAGASKPASGTTSPELAASGPAAAANARQQHFSLFVHIPDSSARSHAAVETPMTREEADGAKSTSPSSPAGMTGHHADGGATLLPTGKLQVRVTRDGKTTVEEMEPNELARLYAQQQAALQKMRGQFDFLTVPDWVRLHPMLGPYLAEATGTFAWVLTLSLTSIRNESIFNTANDTNVTCLPIGFMFTSMVFTFGYISGGHFNPAISLSVFLVRKMDLVRCLGYIVCQVAAAFGAGVVAMLIQGNTDIFVPSVGSNFVSSGIFSELIYTFAVALVVLNTGYSRQSGNFFYGFAIGMTMAAGSASVGHISGGAFNPAAATGLQLSLCMTGRCNELKSFWVYWLAPLVGAIAASLIYSQMFQPVHTQVLQDHKVLRDPAKALMRDPAAVNSSQEGSGRDEEEGQRMTDSDGDNADRSGSDAEISNQNVAQGSGAAVLNDSLTEPTVPPHRDNYKEKHVSSLV